MSVVDDVKARLDILEVVSGYANLHKAGRNYKALCPFHQERTPSFIVFPDTQTWRCFGACGEGGDIFSFVMKAEGWDFSEALRELAKRAGVELAPAHPDQARQQEAADRLRGIVEEAARYFHQRLLDAPDAQLARDYLVRRGLNDQTITTFVLGYAPDDWRQALHHLQMLGYSQDDVIEAGVATRGDKGSVYDRFRHRLMIPIHDGRGHIVGFGARALDKEATPKYLNSPQGPLFDKSHLLYGLDMARRTIRESETAVIVEGYMDTMQAHQAGFTNVVAQMGTALTEDQLRQLERYARRLILALDPDTAGINATMRGLNVARETLDGEQRVTFDPHGMMRYTGLLEMDIRVVSLPGGQDPDDLIRENPRAWDALIAHAVPVADYVIQQGTSHLSDQSSYYEREKAARDLLPILTATENDLQRNVNIQSLARRVRIDERTLIQWMQHRQAAQARPVPTLREQRKLAGRAAAPASSGPAGPPAARESFCLRMLMEQPGWLSVANRKLRELRGNDGTLAEVLSPMHADDFSRADHQAVFRLIEVSLDQVDLDPPDYFQRHLPPELQPVVNQLRQHELEEFRQRLSKPLETELQSIVRDQERINAYRTPDRSVFVQEVLALRRAALERTLRELYFIQQEAQGAGDAGQPHDSAIAAHVRARQIVIMALKQMDSVSRQS